MFELLALSWKHWAFSIPLSLLSIFLMLVILVQRGRGGGLTGALGGMGGQSAFGTKAGDLFTRITIAVAAVWILLCMLTLKVLNNPIVNVPPPARVKATDPTKSGGLSPTVPGGPTAPGATTAPGGKTSPAPVGGTGTQDAGKAVAPATGDTKADNSKADVPAAPAAAPTSPTTPAPDTAPPGPPGPAPPATTPDDAKKASP